MTLWPTGWEQMAEVFRYACRPTCVLHSDACVRAYVPVHSVNARTGCLAGSRKACSETALLSGPEFEGRAVVSV